VAKTISIALYTQKDDMIAHVIRCFFSGTLPGYYSAALPISIACLPL